MTDQATPTKVRLTDGLSPVAWAVVAFGRMQKLVVRADVADELACKWRESDPEATAVPLYTWATVEAERAAERSSRGMFVARLENMQQNGDQWLTVAAVLALLNDCDMLAASERA